MDALHKSGYNKIQCELKMNNDKQHTTKIVRSSKSQPVVFEPEDEGGEPETVPGKVASEFTGARSGGGAVFDILDTLRHHTRGGEGAKGGGGAKGFKQRAAMMKLQITVTDKVSGPFVDSADHQQTR
jgi:hypothetical protein